MVENSEQKSGENPAQLNVLVVDDDPAVIQLFEHVFTSNDFEELAACNLLTATNIQKAKTILETEKVAMVFLDNRLPGGSGIDYAREMRENPTEHPYAQDLPIVLISATQNKDLKPEERHLFFALLPKPFDLEDMIACVQRVRVLKQPIDVSDNRFSGPIVNTDPISSFRIDRAA